jgi:tetratricopeptide (TPR) repeat protein
MATDTPSPPADPAWSSKVDIHFNTETNRGNQVGYNYGSITNHFHQTPHDYQCEFPSVSRASLETRLYRKIDQARRLCDARQWVEAKHLLSEILFGGEVFPPPSERTLLQYNLAHTHFSLKELPEALHHFQDLVEKHEERNEQPQGAVADCRLWLGQTLFHLGRYEDALMHLQIFVFTHEEPVESPYKGKNGDGKSKQEEMKQAEAIVAGRIWLGNTFEALKLFSHARQQLETSLTAIKRSSGQQIHEQWKLCSVWPTSATGERTFQPHRGTSRSSTRSKSSSMAPKTSLRSRSVACLHFPCLSWRDTKKLSRISSELSDVSTPLGLVP